MSADNPKWFIYAHFAILMVFLTAGCQPGVAEMSDNEGELTDFVGFVADAALDEPVDGAWVLFDLGDEVVSALRVRSLCGQREHQLSVFSRRARPPPTVTMAHRAMAQRAAPQRASACTATPWTVPTSTTCAAWAHATSTAENASSYRALMVAAATTASGAPKTTSAPPDSASASSANVVKEAVTSSIAKRNPRHVNGMS
jgi:hypothetical protein